MKTPFSKQQVKIKQETSLYSGFMSLKKLCFDHLKYSGDWQHSVQREILVRDDAVGVLLYDPKLQEFVMVEQLRIGALHDPVSPWLLEVVAGMVESGEDYQQVAERESLEEAGATIKKMIPIVDYWVSPGGSTERVALFLALTDAHKVAEFAGLETEHEDIKVHRIDKQKLLQMLRQGRINNAMALIAVQWFFLNESELHL
ncbi:NUDIX domain-containing protein [Kangiella sp. TOML190]|uniref:NUDIX domain-containing protein n=1 Tax=Kangiella sp. TOML190 TaxID=2931351 RepID=UPI00203F47BA|nr:NUDIX domain-containing protein [Kangiella sp. TOML190]